MPSTSSTWIFKLSSPSKDVFSSAVVVAGATLAADRLREACKCYRQLLRALSWGEGSGADGWQSFMTMKLTEAMVSALGLFFVPRIRATAA
jgi:hypothetical protein